MEFEFRIDDIDKLVNQMSALPSKIQKRGLDGAARAAMRPVQTAARNAARLFDDPLTPNEVWKKIVTQKASRTARRIGGTVMRVGISGGAQKYVDNKDNQRAKRVGKTYEDSGTSFYWRFREFGTEKQAAQPFMQPAFDSNLNNVQDIFAARLRKVIDREAKKGARP